MPLRIPNCIATASRNSGLRSPWQAKVATFPWCRKLGGAVHDDLHRHLPRENGQQSGGGERGEKVRFVGMVARFGDILNRERLIVEIEPRSVFVNVRAGARLPDGP